MRTIILTAAVFAGITAPAAAQQYAYPSNGYPESTPGYYPTVSVPTYTGPQYAPPTYPTPQYAPQPYPYQVPQYAPAPHPYPSAPPPADPKVEFVRSLYQRYLGREPEPAGLQVWLRQLDNIRGDARRLERDFQKAAQTELSYYRTQGYAVPMTR